VREIFETLRSHVKPEIRAGALEPFHVLASQLILGQPDAVLLQLQDWLLDGEGGNETAVCLLVCVCVWQNRGENMYVLRERERERWLGDAVGAEIFS